MCYIAATHQGGCCTNELYFLTVPSLEFLEVLPGVLVGIVEHRSDVSLLCVRSFVELYRASSLQVGNPRFLFNLVVCMGVIVVTK